MTTSAALTAAIVGATASAFWSLATLAAAAAALLLAGAARAFARKRAIENTPTALVRSAAQGYTELRGMAELMAGAPIVAPASLRPCVWYRYRIEHRDRSRDGLSAEWVSIEHGTSDDLFCLTDTSGSCVVDPDGAQVRAARRDHWYGNARVPGCFAARNATWFARLGAGLTMHYRYTEYLIEPGAALYVLGEFVTHDGGGPPGIDLDAAIGDRLRDWKRDRTDLRRRFDRDCDGDIDTAEWAQARAAAEREVLAEQAYATAAPAADVIARPRDRKRPFIISAGTEDTARAQQQWSAWLQLAAGIPLTSAVLWTVLLRCG